MNIPYTIKNGIFIAFHAKRGRNADARCLPPVGRYGATPIAKMLMKQCVEEILAGVPNTGKAGWQPQPRQCASDHRPISKMNWNFHSISYY
jgi:hypothetical protein